MGSFVQTFVLINNFSRKKLHKRHVGSSFKKFIASFKQRSLHLHYKKDLLFLVLAFADPFEYDSISLAISLAAA